jgi:hypothetical protein
MLIKKNYLNFKLKGLRDNDITPLDDDNLDKLLLNNKDFNDKLGKA